MESKRKLGSSSRNDWQSYRIPKRPRLHSVFESVPGESGPDSVVIDSVPSECRPKLNSVVVVPTPGELRSRVRAYSPLKRATPRRQYTCSKLSRHQSKKPANKPENKKENSSQVEEIVQVLSKALVKLHISSTATQTEASNADKSTQTETNLLLEVKAPQRKNNRRCYKC